MGGFRIDGCGVSDRFKHLKSVGVFTCPRCGKNTEFYLDEVKRKIDVFFIPTVPISVKYAIMCSGCKNGFKISEAEKDKVLFNNQMIQISKDGVSLINNESSGYQNIRASPDTRRQSRICPNCNSVIQPNYSFCICCGHRVPEDQSEEAQKPIAQQALKCKKCGAELQDGSVFCTNCGVKIQ